MSTEVEPTLKLTRTNLGRTTDYYNKVKGHRVDFSTGEWQLELKSQNNLQFQCQLSNPFLNSSKKRRVTKVSVFIRCVFKARNL